MISTVNEENDCNNEVARLIEYFKGRREMSTAVKDTKLGGYMPLAVAAGIGSMLGSGIIVGLSATITVWQKGLGLDAGQVGVLSGVMTFAIAFGSLFGGRLADKIGRVLVFNWINLLYAIGAAICVFAPNFTMLLIGLVIAGLASGADLPISMTIVSHDAPNDKVAAQLVSTTQVFWQVGVFISFICAFLVSTMQGGDRWPRGVRDPCRIRRRRMAVARAVPDIPPLP